AAEPPGGRRERDHDAGRRRDGRLARLPRRARRLRADDRRGPRGRAPRGRRGRARRGRRGTRVFVKICGITTPAALDAAVRAGADAVGFVFAESPRRIAPAAARRLCAGLPPSVIRVAVMRAPSAAEWAEVAAEFAPDWLQADAEALARLDLG